MRYDEYCWSGPLYSSGLNILKTPEGGQGQRSTGTWPSCLHFFVLPQQKLLVDCVGVHCVPNLNGGIKKTLCQVRI